MFCRRCAPWVRAARLTPVPADDMGVPAQRGVLQLRVTAFNMRVPYKWHHYALLPRAFLWRLIPLIRFAVQWWGVVAAPIVLGLQHRRTTRRLPG